MNVRKSLVVAAIIALPVVASNAFAAFSVGVGVESVGGQDAVSIPGASADAGQTTAVGLIDLAYRTKIDSDWGIGVGATYDFNKTNFGGGSLSGIGAVSLDGKDHYSVYLQPYYLVAPQTAVFAKVGYNSMKGEMNGTVSGSQTFHGIGYGVGVKTFVSPNVYLQAEAAWVDYSSETTQGQTDKPTTASGIFSVGFQF